MNRHQIILFALIIIHSLTTFAQTNSNDPPLPESSFKENLLEAVRKDDIEQIRTLLAAEKNYDLKKAAVSDGLYSAVGYGNPEIVRTFLEAGADPNGRSEGETYPVILGMSFSITTKLIQTLIDHGANVNLTSKDGVTALMMTARWGNPEVAQFLIDNGAEVDAVNSNGNTALMYAASEPDPKRNLGIIRVLLKAGANPNLRDAEGGTALISAATTGLASKEDVEIVKLLLEAKADPNFKDNDGDRALTRASDKRIIKLLKQYGAKK